MLFGGYVAENQCEYRDCLRAVFVIYGGHTAKYGGIRPEFLSALERFTSKKPPQSADRRGTARRSIVIPFLRSLPFMLRVAEAAYLLGVSDEWVYRRLRSRSIGSIKDDHEGRYLIDPLELADWLEARHVQAA